MSVFVIDWLLEIALRILPDVFQRKSEITVDLETWGFAVFMAMGSGIVVALIPSARIANPVRLMEQISRSGGRLISEASIAFQNMLQEIERLPEVRLVAAGSTIPMGPISTRVDPTVRYSYPGQPAVREGEESRVAMRTATDSFFDVLEIPLVSGRFFDGREVTSANPSLIVNRSMAELVWPGVHC